MIKVNGGSVSLSDQAPSGAGKTEFDPDGFQSSAKEAKSRGKLQKMEKVNYFDYLFYYVENKIATNPVFSFEMLLYVFLGTCFFLMPFDPLNRPGSCLPGIGGAHRCFVDLSLA